MLQEFDIRESSSSSEDEGSAAGAYNANMSQLSTGPDKHKRAAPTGASASAAAALMRARATELEANALLNRSQTNEERPDDAASLHSYRVPNVLTSSGSSGNASATSASGGGSAGALNDEELDEMLSDLVRRRSGGRKSGDATSGRRNGAPSSVLSLNDRHNVDDAPSVASSLGMSHEDTAQRFSGAHDVDASRMSHSSRQSKNIINMDAPEHKRGRDRDIASLERELQASKQAVDVLLRQRNERNEDAARAKLQVSDLTTEKNTLEQERDDLRAELESMRARLTFWQDLAESDEIIGQQHAARAKLEVDGLTTEKKTLEQERDDLRVELESMRARLAESDGIIDQQQELIKHNEAEVQLYEQRTKQIGDELEALRDERDNLNAELAAGCDEVISSQEKWKAAEGEISALRSENSALKSDLSDNRSENKSSEDRRKAAQAEVSKLRAERDKLRSLRTTVDSLTRDKEDLTASVGEKLELIRKLKGDLAAERKQNQASRKEIQMLKESNSRLESRAESFAAENESFKRQLDVLQRSFEELKQSNSDANALLSELEDAQAALAALEKSFASLEKENQCLVEAATEVEEELSIEKEQRAALDSNITLLTKEADESRLSLQKLTEELSKEKTQSATLREELEDSNAKIIDLQAKFEIIRSDKEIAETDYIDLLAELENARALLADAKTDADTARTDAADGIVAFEQRLKEKLEVQLNEHKATLEVVQMNHEGKMASLQEKYDEVTSSTLEKDEIISILRAQVNDLELSLRENIETFERKEEQMAQELSQVGGWLEKSKQREAAVATELKNLQVLSQDTAGRSQAAFDQRLEEELEIQRLAYEASAQTIESQTRADTAAKIRSLQEEMQTREADSKKIINKLISELDHAKADLNKYSSESEKAYSEVDRLELEVTTLRESLKMLEEQNSALIKGRERILLASSATQTDSPFNEIRESGSQAGATTEVDDSDVRSVEESLRQTKVELAAALTAFNLSEKEAHVSDASVSVSENVNLLRALCKFVNSEGSIGDSDLENAWRSLGMLRRSISQTNLQDSGSVALLHEADEETEEDESGEDDDSILRNLTLSFDKAFTALKNGVAFIDEDDQAEDKKSEVDDSTKLPESQALELVPRPPDQETSIVEFGNDDEFQTEGRFGIVLGRQPSSPHQLEYSIDKSNEEIAAIVKVNEEMLAIVPELQMRCDFLENERDVLLHEKEDLLNETLDLLETSRAESEAQVAAAVSMVRSDALAEIARCKAEYQQLMMKYQESQKEKLEETSEIPTS